MKLATVEDVLARMNLTNTVSVQNAGSIASALEAATPVLESLLRTPLASTTRIDYYDYAVGRLDTAQPTFLWLTQRYLEGSPTVYVSPDGTPLGSSFTGLEPLSPLDYILDKAKGTLWLLNALNPGRSAVAVKYSAGFEEGSQDIPAWLREAAIAAAIHLNHTQSIAHGKKDRVNFSKPLSSIVYALVNEHIVTQYDGEYPSYSVTL